MIKARDRGESLIEVVITIMIISVAVVALIASLASASRSSISHRRAQDTDVVLRDFAEAVKLATATCSPGSPYAVSFTPPDGYTVGGSADDGLFDGQSGTCPVTTAIQLVTVSAAYTGTAANTMQFGVRTP